MFLEDGDVLPIHDKFLILSLECAVEFAVGGILLEHGDHVVETYEGVTDGNSISTLPTLKAALVTRRPV